MNKKDMFIREKLQQDKVISDRANKIFDNIKGEFKMENNEKKVIKISLGTFIAIAASLVIVGFIGINIYANSLGKPNIISGIKSLIEKESENTDEIAKELFEKAMLAIRDPYKYYEGTDNEAEEIQGKYYRKTNSTYDEVELKYSEIFTDEALKNVLDFNFNNKDGILYALKKVGGTPWQLVELNVEKINEEDEELTYNAIYKLSYTDDPAGKEPKEEKCQFKMKKVDGEYRIFSTNFCNLDGTKENLNNTTNNYLDNETAKTIIQSYLNIIGAKEGSPDAVLGLEEIGLIDRNSEIPGGDYIDKENYRSSNINYEDFKNKMLQYMTEDLFNGVGGYKNVNGKLYIFDGGATGIGFDIKEISLISSNENSYKYSIRALEYPPEEGINCVGEVELQKNQNGKYVVSELSWTENETNVNNNNTETSGSNQNILYGDVDLDGEVTDWDEIYLTRCLNGWDGYDLKQSAKLNADVNYDGTITQGDVNVLKKYLVGEITKLPYRTSGIELVAKQLPGITIKYPDNWTIREVNKSKWGEQPGEVTCEFEGTVNNVEITVRVYEPFNGVGDYKNLIKNECSKYGIKYSDSLVDIGFNIGSTDSRYLEWQTLTIGENSDCYYHIDKVTDTAYKIEVRNFNYLEGNNNLLPAYRVIDDIILGTRIGQH